MTWQLLTVVIAEVFIKDTLAYYPGGSPFVPLTLCRGVLLGGCWEPQDSTSSLQCLLLLTEKIEAHGAQEVQSYSEGQKWPNSKCFHFTFNFFHHGSYNHVFLIVLEVIHPGWINLWWYFNINQGTNPECQWHSTMSVENGSNFW